MRGNWQRCFYETWCFRVDCKCRGPSSCSKKACGLFITAARANQFVLVAFCNFSCLACPFVLGAQYSSIMQPLWLEDILKRVQKCAAMCCILCLTYMSMCPLLQDGCSSFDIALELGKKIKSLQVATCGASSEKDKKLDEKPNLHSSFLVVLKLILCWPASVKTYAFDVGF